MNLIVLLLQISENRVLVHRTPNMKRTVLHYALHSCCALLVPRVLAFRSVLVYLVNSLWCPVLCDLNVVHVRIGLLDAERVVLRLQGLSRRPRRAVVEHR